MSANDTSSEADRAIDCPTAARRMWDFLDGELDAARMTQMESHLAECRQCPSHFAFAQALLESIAAARAGVEDPDALRRRVPAALQAEGFQSQRV